MWHSPEHDRHSHRQKVIPAIYVSSTLVYSSSHTTFTKSSQRLHNCSTHFWCKDMFIGRKQNLRLKYGRLHIPKDTPSDERSKSQCPESRSSFPLLKSTQALKLKLKLKLQTPVETVILTTIKRGYSVGCIHQPANGGCHHFEKESVRVRWNSLSDISLTVMESFFRSRKRDK